MTRHWLYLSNNMSNAQLETSSSLTEAQVAVQTCKQCRRRTAVLWNCRKCQEQLCGECRMNHENSRHSMSVQRKCYEHALNDISHYCQNCDTPCCSKCTNEFHKGHKCLLMGDKVEEVKRQLGKYKKNLKKDVLKKLQERRDICSMEKNLLDSASNMTKSEIKERQEYLKRTFCTSVDTICDEIIDNMEKRAYEYDICGIESRMEKIDFQEERVLSLIQECSQMGTLDSLELVDFFVRKCPDPESLLPPQTKATKVPYFEPADFKLSKRDIGRVHFSRSRKDRTQYLVPKEKPVRLKVKEKKEVLTPFPPSSVAAVENLVWICNESEQDLVCFDMNKSDEQTTYEHESNITTFVLKSKTDIILADSKHDVSLLSTDFSTVKLLFNTGDYIPNGLCITSSKKIIVSMYGVSRTSHLAVFDFCGNRQDQTIMYDEDRKVLFHSPGQLVQNGRDGLLVVVEPDMCKLLAVTTTGKLQWRYDGEASETDENFNPWGVAVDDLLNIIVSDNRNHCLHYIDQNGQFLRLIIQEDHGVDFPLGIAIYQEKRLVVGSMSKGLTLFRYLK